MKMYSRGTIKLVIDKGKPGVNRKTGKQFLPNLVYYPNWSWKITPRTKEWEDYRLKETNPCGGIIITPTYDEIKKAFMDVLIHEFQIDQVIKRKSEFSKWKKFIKELASVIEQMELDKFEDGIPEEIRNCKKEVKNEDTN